MTDDSSKLSTLDFVISVLVNYEKELEKDIVKLEQITKKLKRHVQKGLSEKLLTTYLKLLTKKAKTKPKPETHR